MINYYLLTKPGIIMGNLLTFTAGFILASPSLFQIRLFVSTVIGLALIIASACVFNNILDRSIDLKMKRTRQRPIPKGLVSINNATIFATLLGMSGSAILFFETNTLAFLTAEIGFLVYVFAYTLWKAHTVYGTAIGSIAGAIPPVVGYCAAGDRFDSGAVVLFVILVLWQMPHFFAIALMHLKDYQEAKIPVLPLVKGIQRTKIHMAVYIAAFIGAATFLTLLGYVGLIYLIATLVTGALWLTLALFGFAKTDTPLWGRQMFHSSLGVIGTVCLLIILDKN